MGLLNNLTMVTVCILSIMSLLSRYWRVRPTRNPGVNIFPKTRSGGLTRVRRNLELRDIRYPETHQNLLLICYPRQNPPMIYLPSYPANMAVVQSMLLLRNLWLKKNAKPRYST